MNATAARTSRYEHYDPRRLRKLLGGLAVCAAVLLPAATLATPALAAPAGGPTAGHIANWLTNLNMTDEGHNALVRVTSGSSYYVTINCQRWTDPNNNIVSVCEWQDGNNECLNAATPGGGQYYLYSDSCSKGDAFELFYVNQCCHNGNGYWLFNAGVINHYGDNKWLFVTQVTGDTDIAAYYGPGYGDQAIWYFW